MGRSVAMLQINGQNFRLSCNANGDNYASLCELKIAEQNFAFAFEVCRNGTFYAKSGTESLPVKWLRSHKFHKKIRFLNFWR